MQDDDELEELRRLAQEEKEERSALRKVYNNTYKERHPEKVREWNNSSYHRYKDKILPYRRNKRQKLKAELIELKGGKCADCGGKFPAYAYDFHHVNGRDMVEGNLMSLGRVAMLEELNKCIVLCAICHRGRHVKEEENE